MVRTACIIDDDEGMREILARVVRAAGLSPALYDSAEAFVQNADKSEIGCMLLDIELRGMSGIALLEDLARKEIDFPVFLISGAHSATTAATAKRVGAVVIDKPFDVRLLAQRIRNAVGEA
jgi:FixJ family two-component response regulator